MVFPKTTGRSMSVEWMLDACRAERIETIAGVCRGTSIPTVPFPGIGAIILIPSAERLRAISS